MILLGILTGCASTSDWKADPIDLNNINIEKAIRKELNKPSGNLTTSDLHKIRELSLGRYQLTNVSALKQLNQLEWLDLYENRINDVTALGQLNKLKYLDLHGNQIKDLRPLRELKQLSELYLRDNPDLTKAQIEQLKKSLPRCSIDHNAGK